MLRPYLASTVLLGSCLICALSVPAAPAAAAPAGKPSAPALVSPLKVEVTLDRPNWTYAVGESATFVVRVSRDGMIVPGTRLHYAIGFEKMPPLRSGDAEMAAAGLTFETGAIDKAGFISCEVEVAHEGRTYRGRAAAAFSPESSRA